jgi:hypothetical protein
MSRRWSTERFALPAELVDRLDKEADIRGISTAELVDTLLFEHLPAILAGAMRDHMDGRKRVPARTRRRSNR